MRSKKLSILKHSKIKYDIIDLMIIEGLGKFGPRNLYKIAKELGIPESTIRYRLNRLFRKKLLRLHTNIYHTYLGLKKHVVFADVNPAYLNVIDEFFSIIDFWVYLKRVHGPTEQYHVLYIAPPENSQDIDDFLREMINLDLIYGYKKYYSTCYYNVNPTTTWYDLNKNEWIFDWESIFKELDTADTELPYTLKDPSSYPLKADTMDILILKELEKNPLISYTDLAELIGTQPQNIYYHYKNHIIGRGLIEDFQVYLLKFDVAKSIFLYLIIEFTNYTNFAKVTNIFRNKPFAQVMGKIIGENKLFLYVYIPVEELTNLLNTLSRLASMGIVKNYEYRMSSAFDPARRQTISYRNFAGTHWVYHHEAYMDALHQKYNSLMKSIMTN